MPFLMPGPHNEDDDEMSERELRIFILMVYASAAVLCLLSAIPWICVSTLKPAVEDNIPVPSFVWLISTFVLLTVLSCVQQTRITRWFCWGLVIAIVFCMTVAGCYHVADVSVWVVLGSLVVAFILVSLLHLYGAMAPTVILPNLLCTCFIMILGFITLFVLLMMRIFTKEPRYTLATAIVGFIILICLAPFQARFICGRMPHGPHGEVAANAVEVYIHFCFLTAFLIVFVVYKEL
ncbi:hypothetical protein KR054_002408 [Drosophila jambulina]|nr:hypothetical protein KR054_002408 [Drosophila jambulina]